MRKKLDYGASQYKLVRGNWIIILNRAQLTFTGSESTRNTTKRFEICSDVTIKAPERGH